MKYKNIKNYSSIVFDCDGVILNSNNIKSKAFYFSTLEFGEDNAKKLVKYHIKNGGISRFIKFKYFIEEILNKKFDEFLHLELLKKFSDYTKKELLTSEIVSGLDRLKDYTINSNWLIVSGGMQSELKSIFKKRFLDKYFESGIYGSPDSKETILIREIKNQNINFPALYIGDSKYDYEVATKHGLDFVFISQWTEVKDFKIWCIENKIKYYKDLNCILNEL